MKVNIGSGGNNFQFDSRRMDQNLKRAQKKLDMQILGDTLPFVPFLQGELRSSGHIVEPGIIQWDGPYAHYQYTGDVYLTEDGRSWANQYEKKYPTGTPIKYHEPGTEDHWFEKAKAQHYMSWVDLVQKEVGK